MPEEIIVTSNILPEGVCLPGDANALLQMVANNLNISLAEAFALFNFGSNTPPVDQQNRPWFRTDVFGNLVGIYTYVGGAWTLGIGGGAITGDIKWVYADAASIIDPWFLCNGQVVGRASGSFTTPDLRGKCLIGTGLGSGLTNRVLGDTGGEETHLLVSLEMPQHTHPSLNGTGFYINSGGIAVSVQAGSNLGTDGTTGNAGGNGAHNNMQPYFALHAAMYIAP